MNERDPLRQLCVDRQGDLCVVCGHGMYGDSQVHEAIIKRSDLPADDRIFVPENCVALHALCHENTASVDSICTKYLVHAYGTNRLARWLLGLEMVVLPARAARIVANLARNRNTFEIFENN